MKRLSLVASGATILGLLLAGCAPDSTGGQTSVDQTSVGQTSIGTQTETSPVVEASGLADMSAPEIIDHLDRMPVFERPTDLMASVRMDSLVLSDGAEETTLDLPGDLSYVSIAPFVNATHDCYYHSLTTCRGEMANTNVDVRITHNASGDVLVDETVTTFDNGFVGYWLPRDFDGTIEISQGELTGTAPISTQSEAATCVTTLRLI